MSVSYSKLKTLVDDAQRVVRGQIQKIDLHIGDVWILSVRIPGETLKLQISLNSPVARTSIARALPSKLPADSATMVLRKHLLGARIQKLALAEDDRVIFLEMTRDDENPLLIIEHLGHQQNLVLAIDSKLAWTLHFDSRLRTGEAYIQPDPPPFSPDEENHLAAEAIEQELAALVDSQIEEDSRAMVLQGLKREHKRAKRLIKNLESDLERAVESEEKRKVADLLKASLGSLSENQRSVKVIDYWNDMQELEIDIPPQLTPLEYIQELYRTYKRLKSAKGIIEERLLKAYEAESQIASGLEAARSCSVDELQKWKHLIKPSPQKSSSKIPMSRLPYLEFTGSTGIRILVGRSSRDNDTMRSKFAKGNDIWLHARDWPGSHVILKTADHSLPDLIDAALLAAHYSKGKNDSTLEVTWTQVKHVRKPKGASPGLVYVAGGQTIVVDPQHPRLSELLAQGKGT